MIPTPIADFLDKYASSEASRFHMPGHKGRRGDEKYDITEIDGAGDLFADEGITAESEKTASSLFGCATYYTAEGSSTCIRTMLALAKREGKCVIAGRNAHRSFITAAILLDLDVSWLTPRDQGSYLSCNIGADDVEEAIVNSETTPFAVYITTPDYLGNIVPIDEIASVCKKHGVLLLVDNAHGAYLKFLERSKHPVDLGADMCCDSAHKTLPVLTGGAYLHLSKEAEERFSSRVKEAMRLFSSSSPSYLIMRSLDLANRYIYEHSSEYSKTAKRVSEIKDSLEKTGYKLVGNEPLKITIETKPYGYTGDSFAKLLLDSGVVSEFHDPDYVSFMITPQNTEEDLSRLEDSLLGVKRLSAIDSRAPALALPKKAMTPGTAFFAECEIIPTADCEGRILSSLSFSCPPAVPLAVCGEVISRDVREALEYYGIEKISVVKE